MAERLQARVKGRRNLWARGSFRIAELMVEQQVGGEKSERPYFSFERGDAVAALIVSTTTRQVILVEQYRPSTVQKLGHDGLLLETCAGMIMSNESELDCLRREVEEETGYVIPEEENGRLKGVVKISSFFPSPGGSSERIFLYYVPVDCSTPVAQGGGKREEGELVETRAFDLDDFFQRLEQGEFLDSKILIAGNWLRGWLQSNPINAPPLDTREGAEHLFSIEAAPQTFIGYRCGDIASIKDVDVWVNSENADFRMDRLWGDTLSSRIRTLGAKTNGGKLVDDTIRRALFAELALGSALRTGRVLTTAPGELARTHNVRSLIHASSLDVQVDLEKGTSKTTGNVADLRNCVRHALIAFDRLNRRRFSKSLKSILFPLFGQSIIHQLYPDLRGQAGIERLANELVSEAVDYVQANPGSRLERLLFLAYTMDEIEILDRVLSRRRGLRRRS